MMLHLLNRSPQFDGLYWDLSEAFGADDHLLLIEDACYAALPAAAASLAAFGGRVSALSEDAASRGLLGRLSDDVALVDMAGFVALTATFPRSLSWF
ncbi:sulfurtransferase complex subunit TusB [Salinicola endophyticus]|uniref:Sulfurtransferase complex subunit TusB n=1 Tax=Salinicola endophyticus TaxID=1949083 RepID=A0AB74UBD1_9GAMM